MRILTYVIGLVLCFATSAAAHEGHADAPGSESASGATSGPIEVSEVAQRNLGLAVQEAELRPIETTLRVIGEIQGDPRRSA